eukprot:m.30534 g.30534  ORF g.30534 m.30534 type:complete len:630 (-) comp5233_c0_seq1:1200-3089(-)
MADIEAAFHFLGDEQRGSPEAARRTPGAASTASAMTNTNTRANGTALSFDEFAMRYFQDKTPNGRKYLRAPLPGPLIKQIWGDGDSEKVLSVWVTILRFLGDIPEGAQALSNLQKVQLIVNIGITRPNTRDEIFAQLCRQINGNPNAASKARAWILMALCAGCFHPTDRFVGVLKNFISTGPPAYVPFVERLLSRSVVHGPRKMPPTSLEMQAAFTKRHIELSVDFVVGTQTVQCDAQTTAAEITAELLRNPLISKQFGFSLFLGTASSNEVLAVGTGPKRICDGISQFEAVSEGNNRDWRALNSNRPWFLKFQREVFTPWGELEENLDLVYTQILEAVSHNLVTIPEHELAYFLCLLYVLEHGFEFNSEHALDVIEGSGIASINEDEDLIWVDRMKAEFHKRDFRLLEKQDPDLRTEVVEFARKYWFMFFSQTFLDCKVVAGDATYKNCTVAVNNQGVYILKDSKTTTRAGGSVETLASFPYLHIVQVDPLDQDDSMFALTTVDETRAVFEFHSARCAADLHNILDFFHKGLCRRSKYAVAHLPVHSPGGSFLSFEVGDLLVLEKPFAEAEDGGWCTGVCARTKAKGDFPSANVHVLPTLSRPSEQDLANFARYCKQEAALHDDDDDL